MVGEVWCAVLTHIVRELLKLGVIFSRICEQMIIESSVLNAIVKLE